jgi:hypothetical protein
MALFFVTCDVTHCTMTLHFLLLGSSSVWPFNHHNVDLSLDLWLVHYCQSSSLCCCLQLVFTTLGHWQWWQAPCVTDARQLNLLLLEMFISCPSNWWDFLWLHYSFSASLDLVAHLPSIIVALTSLSVLMSTDILVSFSEVQHLVEIHSFKGLQSTGVRLGVIDQSRWSHLLPCQFLAPSALFPVPTCGNGLLSNNVDNTFNLYDGCTRC